jgi:hypothetical protein
MSGGFERYARLIQGGNLSAGDQLKLVTGERDYCVIRTVVSSSLLPTASQLLSLF